MVAPTDIPAKFLPLVLDFLFDDNDVLMTQLQERNLIDIKYHGLCTVIHDIIVKLSVSTYMFPLNDAILNLTNPLQEAV